MKLHFRSLLRLLFLLLPILVLLISGCSLIPETRHRDVLHNPFPQLKRVAVLPFFNQSSEPTVNSDQVAESYYAALQAIPGFEVLPVGVAKAQWLQYALIHGEPRTGKEFQQLAQQMGVEALVVGSVTDFDAYYPPRLAMTVHWYAANEGFHAIPSGYGLPWGTDAEKQIPPRIVREAEFELARSQLATQTPLISDQQVPTAQQQVERVSGQSELRSAEQGHVAGNVAPVPLPEGIVAAGSIEDGWVGNRLVMEEIAAPLPPDWPDPTDLIPDPPSAERPIALVSHEPVLSHTRLYRGDDRYFTNRLADYVETGDDARPGGWQDYLKRSDDFIRFCCHLHITEMLESRGGSDQSDLILRWPLSRY